MPSIGKLTIDAVREIRAAFDAAKPLRKRWRKPLARKHGISLQHCSNIGQRHLYRWVPNA